MGTETVYRCSDGRLYGDVDVWDRLESGAWTPCCWEESSGREWVETNEGELFELVPVSRSALPAAIRVERLAAGVRVVSDEPSAGNGPAAGGAAAGREP